MGRRSTATMPGEGRKPTTPHIAAGMQWLTTGEYTYDLQHPPLGRVATAIGFLRGLHPDQLNGTGNKEVAFTFRNGTQRKFTGQSLLLTFSVPQFFFHVTTAYDILRHCGVELVKKDFLGTPAQTGQG